MTTADGLVARPGWRAWLLDETPASRTQARLGQAYVSWLAFRRNPLAMVGLIVLAVAATFLFWKQASFRSLAKTLVDICVRSLAQRGVQGAGGLEP